MTHLFLVINVEEKTMRSNVIYYEEHDFESIILLILIVIENNTNVQSTNTIHIQHY